MTAQITRRTTDEVQVPRVYLAWRGPAAMGADVPSLALASRVLGGGKVSRLYKRLVYDEKIAQDVQATTQDNLLGGTFQITATAKPGVDPERLIREITEEVAALATTPPSAAELERAQNTNEAQLLYRLESPLQRAILTGVDADAARLSVTTLRKTLEPTLALIAKLVTQPAFAAGELARVKSDRLTAIEQRRDQPPEVASIVLRGALFGPASGYGHPDDGHRRRPSDHRRRRPGVRPRAPDARRDDADRRR